MTSPSADTVAVTGGVGSIAVDADGLRAAAPILRGLAGEVEEAASAVRAAGWALWAVVPIDPAGRALLAEAHRSVETLAAAVSAAAAGVRALATRLRAAADAYTDTDTSLVGDVARWLGSAVHGVLAPAWTGLRRLPEAVAVGAGVGFSRRDALAGAQAALTEDPQLVDPLGPAGSLWFSPQLWAGLTAAERWLEQQYPDGFPVVTAAGTDPARAARAAPRSLGAILDGLAWRSAHETETSTTRGGEIDVRFLHHADGTRTVIVDIPGTRDWSGPGRDPDVTNLAANLRAVRGAPTTYARGVLAAMARAGVRPNDRVLLAGHSLGGMVAVEVAAVAARTRRFDVADVITAGSPIGRTVGRLPASIQVLALENTRDLVPELDGRANPAQANVTTVTGDRQGFTVGGNHDLGASYAAIARRAEAGGDASVRYFAADVAGFLDADSVRTERFVITRGY